LAERDVVDLLQRNWTVFCIDFEQNNLRGEEQMLIDVNIGSFDNRKLSLSTPLIDLKVGE
jgi:hypothetical protein